MFPPHFAGRSKGDVQYSRSSAAFRAEFPLVSLLALLLVVLVYEIPSHAAQYSQPQKPCEFRFHFTTEI
jgi:hypothetical protein